MRTRALVALALAALCAQPLGCMTARVSEKWHARDRLERIELTLVDARSDEVGVDWTLAGGGASRRGRLAFDARLAACETVALSVRHGAQVTPMSVGEAVRLPLDGEDGEGPAPLATPTEACSVLLGLLPHDDESDPALYVRTPERMLGRSVLAAPRRHLWAPLFPLAAVADAALFVGTLGLVVVFSTPRVHEGTL